MNIEKIVADVTKYPYPEDEFISITIEARNSRDDAIFAFKLGYCGKEEDWSGLAMACTDESEYYYFDEETNNGISVSKDCVSFELESKYDQSSMFLAVPKSMCIDAFEYVRDEIKTSFKVDCSE